MQLCSKKTNKRKTDQSRWSLSTIFAVKMSKITFIPFDWYKCWLHYKRERKSTFVKKKKAKKKHKCTFVIKYSTKNDIHVCIYLYDYLQCILIESG